MSRKPGYLASIKTELADKQRQLEQAHGRVRAAHAESVEADRARDTHAREPHLPWTAEQERDHGRAEGAAHRLKVAEREAQELASDCQRLQAIIEAPSNLERARTLVTDRIRQRSAIQVDLAHSNVAVAKLQERVITLEAVITLELQSAADAMANSVGEAGAVSEDLLSREIELRVARAALATKTEKSASLEASVSEAAGAVLEAQQHFLACQSAVANVELQELIHAHLAVFCRATAASYTNGWTNRSDRCVVDIPRHAFDAARAALASEMPAS